MNNKAVVVESTVVYVVVFLLTALITLGLFGQIEEATKDIDPVVRCRTSVQSAAAIKKIAGQPQGRLDCERDWTFFEKETQAKINRKVLLEINECYRAFGEGRVDFSKTGDIIKEEQCAICTSIEFKEGSTAQKSYKKESFKLFLDSASKTTSQSWGAFIDTAKASQTSGLLFKIPPQIDPLKKYLLFFKYEPKSRLDWAKNLVDYEKIETAPVIILEEFPKDSSDFSQCKKLLN